MSSPLGASAEDSAAVLNPEAADELSNATSRLGGRAYPTELIRSAQLKNGKSVRLRPIRPEDEPHWHAMLRGCSAETLHRRFRYMFKSTTHEMATRFCTIDYDRELAIVAELGDDSQLHLIGVGRLIADSAHAQAEFAILVADPWQGLGLGSILMDYCLEIAQGWRLKKVTAETAIENHRMIAMFERRGFVGTIIPPDTMAVSKEFTR